ncbi:TPA: hypothetical protein ACH3X1_006992 [Trebouxia sp. C0004]
MRKRASGSSKQAPVSASPATSYSVISSHLPNWARTTDGDAAQDRPPAQDVTNRLLSGSSKRQADKLHVFPEQSTEDVPILHHQGLAQQRYTPSYRHSGSTPAFSTASGPLSAVPTGFSSDARRVVYGLAGPEPGTTGVSSHHKDQQHTFISPSSNAQGTGWSALYDESSEEEDQSGLQAEESQASSLSFQPHNLFKEHFAIGSSAATQAAELRTSPSPPANGSTSTITLQAAAASGDLQHSLSTPRSAAFEAQASALVELEHQAGSKGKTQAETSYTPRVRRAWGLSAESAVRAEQPNCASSSPKPSRSPAGKPPLPWTAGWGSLLPVGTGKSPRMSAKGAKPLAASPRGQPSGTSRSPSASPRLPPGVCKGAQAAQSQSRERPMEAQGTPCTPAARRSGRTGAGRGLATQLVGMQAQLDDLDAMWSAVNAHKSQAASRNGVQVDIDVCSGNSSDSTALPKGKQALPSRGRTSAEAAAAAGLPSRHTQVQAVMPPSHPLPLSSDPRSGSMNADVMRRTVVGSGNVPSDSFPGFALVAAKPGAVTAGDPQASDSHDSVSGGSAEPLLFPPVPSQETVLRLPTSPGNAQLVHKKKRASAVSRSIGVLQAARLAEATSHAQLSRASQNPLRHSTGGLQEVLSRSATAAAVGTTHKPSTAASQTVKGEIDRLPQQSQQPGSIAASQPRHSAVSPFSAKSPEGQLQALEHMLQSLPHRHSKAPAAPATSRAPTPAPHNIHPSFRLSFSPTGIPSVNPDHSPGLHTQTQQTTEEPAHGVAESEHKAASAEVCTAADGRASGSVGENHALPETRSPTSADNEPEACSAEDQPSTAQLASGPADDSWAASKPEDTASQGSANAVASSRLGLRARASAAAVSKARAASPCEADGVSKLARHIQPALVDTAKCSSSTAGIPMATVYTAMHGSTVVSEHTLSQPPADILGPAVTHPGAGEAVSMHAAASASESATTNEPEAVLLLTDQSERCEASAPVSQAQTLAAQLSDNNGGLLAAGQAALLSGSHSSSSLSPSLLPPSTPMLAWLNALASPGSAAVPEQTPLLSTPASPLPLQASIMSMPDQATPKLSHHPAPAASLAHTRIQAGNLTPHPRLQAGQITSPMDATLLRPQAVQKCSAQTNPGAVPNQATSDDPVPKQATPDDPVPRQIGLLSAVSSTRAADQSTPDAWPRQATPALGLPTGLSGLTTPPSAAEMHRCYPGVNDLDEFDCEEGNTVTLENPAYDNSFSNKACKGPPPRHHPRHPLLDLGQLASNPAFECEAGALSSRHVELTPRRPTPAPTAHPNRHTPTKIAYRPKPRTLGTDRLQRNTGDLDGPQQASGDAGRAAALSPSGLPVPCKASPDGMESSRSIPGPKFAPQEGTQQRLTGSSAPAHHKPPPSQTAARQIKQHQAPVLAALDPQGTDLHTATSAADASHDADGHALLQTSDMLPNRSSSGESHTNAEAAGALAMPFTAAHDEQSDHEPAPQPASRPTFALGLNPLSVKGDADPQQAVLQGSPAVQTRRSPPGALGTGSQTGAATPLAGTSTSSSVGRADRHSGSADADADWNGCADAPEANVSSSSSTGAVQSTFALTTSAVLQSSKPAVAVADSSTRVLAESHPFAACGNKDMRPAEGNVEHSHSPAGSLPEVGAVQAETGERMLGKMLPKPHSIAAASAARADVYAVLDALLLDKLSDVCSSSTGVQSASQTLARGAASSKGSAQASCTPSQEVKSNSKVSSTGKSKRWSALAFWKKSAGKAKQPAEAKAAVSGADEELAPLRRRSSSYHSSFIALAKQGRHAKGTAKTKPEASAAAPSARLPSHSSFTCFTAPAVACGNTPRQHTPQQQTQLQPTSGSQSGSALKADAIASYYQQHQLMPVQRKCAVENQAGYASAAMPPGLARLDSSARTAVPSTAPSSSPDLGSPGAAGLGPAPSGAACPALQGPASSGAACPILQDPATPSWQGLLADKPPTPLSSHPIDALDESDSAPSGTDSSAMSPAHSKDHSVPADNQQSGPLSLGHHPSDAHGGADQTQHQAISQHPQQQTAHHSQQQHQQQQADTLSHAQTISTRQQEQTSSSPGSDAVVLDFDSELSGSNNGLTSPSSSVASWQRALSQLGSDSSHRFSQTQERAFASSQHDSPEGLWSGPEAFGSRASAHSPGLFPDFAPMFASTPLPGAWQQHHLPSPSITPSLTGCQQEQSAEQLLGSAWEPFSQAAAQLRAAVTHAVKLLTAPQAAAPDLRTDLSDDAAVRCSSPSLSLGSDVPVNRSQEQCQLSFEKFQQPYIRDAFRRSPQSSLSQAATWVPQAEMQMQSCAEGDDETCMTQRISADALQQHASNLQSGDAHIRRHLLEHEMHQQCCNLQHALRLSREHL